MSESASSDSVVPETIYPRNPSSLEEYDTILRQVNCLTDSNVKYLLYISKMIYVNHNGRNSAELTTTLARVYFKSAQVSLLTKQPISETRRLLDCAIHHINTALELKPKSSSVLTTWAEILTFDRVGCKSLSNDRSLIPLIITRLHDSLGYCSSYEKNPLAVYMLAKITYGIACSNWFEKKVIRIKNGSRFLLKHTLIDSKEYFTCIAFKWNPYYRATCIWLAKIEYKLGNLNKSLEWADKASSMKQFDPEDALMDKQLNKLLERLFKYRTKTFVSVTEKQ